MKRQIILFCMFLSQVVAYGQEYMLTYGKYKEETTTCIFGNKVNIRNNPSINSEVIDQLTIGEQVKVLKECEETLKLNDYEEAWYQIEYQGKQGYVWGGLLAKGIIERDISTQHSAKEKIIFGIKKMEEYKKIAEARYCDAKGKIISTVEFEAIEMNIGENVHLFNYSTYAKYVGEKGFSPEIKFIAIHFAYEACDFTNGEVFLFLKNEKLHYAFDAKWVSNEFGSMHADLVFPNDEDGERNVVKHIKTYLERDEEYDTKNTWTAVSKYIWTGEKFYSIEKQINKKKEH